MNQYVLKPLMAEVDPHEPMVRARELERPGEREIRAVAVRPEHPRIGDPQLLAGQDVVGAQIAGRTTERRRVGTRRRSRRCRTPGPGRGRRVERASARPSQFALTLTN